VKASVGGESPVLKSVVRVLTAGFATACVLAALGPGSALAFGPITSFGPFGTGAGEVGVGGDLDIAADGSVYVPDFFNNRFDVFSAQGEFRSAFGRGVSPTGSNTCTAVTVCVGGELTDEWSGLVRPEHLAVGPEGNVFVASLNRVNVFSAQGGFRSAFGKDVNPDGGDTCDRGGCQIGIADTTAGSISPAGLALDSNGRVYVSGSNARIDVFSREGEFLFAFGDNVNPGGDPGICSTATGCGKGTTSAQAGAVSGIDVDVTPSGDIAVLNAAFHRVDVFSPQGEFRFAFGGGVNPAGGDTCTLITSCVAGRAGVGAGEIGPGANSIAVTPSGSFLISNGVPAERIDEYGPAGNFIRGFGGGVVDGEEEFQVCTTATGCQPGFRSLLPGATGAPQGVAVDAGGTIYVAEEAPVRIEVIGGAPDPPRRRTQPPPPPPVVSVSNQFKLGKLALNKRRGTATLTVSVPGAGEVALGGRGIRLTVAVATGAGDVKLPVKLSGSSARRLARTGKARVRVLVLFEPAGGDPRIQGKPAVLEKRLKR
jgi:sugar lactone lactonase YvrE